MTGPQRTYLPLAVFNLPPPPLQQNDDTIFLNPNEDLHNFVKNVWHGFLIQIVSTIYKATRQILSSERNSHKFIIKKTFFGNLFYEFNFLI